MTLLNKKHVDEEIKKIKYPILFLFKLVTYKDDISDNDMSIILRLFLNHHHESAQEYNIKLIFMNDYPEESKTWKALHDFYKYIKKFYSLVFNLKNYYESYPNKDFWNKHVIIQIEYLEQLKNQFLGIFDNAKGGALFHFKLLQLAKEEKISLFIKDNIIERLRNIYILFGAGLFKLLSIPIITIEMFLEFTDEQIINYLNAIYNAFKELLEETIQIFETYNLIRINIYNLFNPVSLIINIIR